MYDSCYLKRKQTNKHLIKVQFMKMLAINNSELRAEDFFITHPFPEITSSNLFFFLMEKTRKIKRLHKTSADL